MQAAYISQPGPADAIQVCDMPRPTAGKGEVLVKVHASAVNPIDTYIRAGVVKMNLPLPFIPGCDLAGVIEAVGPDTRRFRVGDRVWGSNQGLLGRQGTLAEYAAVHEDWLYPTPSGQSDELSAAGALTGITAHLGLFLHGDLQPGQVVFVNGGTGGVGSAVVQFAHAFGAKVIATVGDTVKAELCRSLGADVVLNYKAPDFAEKLKSVAAEMGGLSLYWETQREPSFDNIVPLMRRRGRIILMAGRDAKPQFPVGPFYVNELRMAGFAMFNASPDEQRTAALQMNRWWEAGKWRPQIGARFPLAEAAKAHALQEANTLQKQGTLTGKIVVNIV